MMAQDAGMGVSQADGESEPIDLSDPLGGAAFGLPMLEKLLLALVDAHPLPEGLPRRKRLDQAMRAIAGRGASDNPLPRHPLEELQEKEAREDSALLWMAQRYLASPNSGLSDRSLADEAARKFYPTADLNYHHAKMEDLRKKFSGAYDKRRKGWREDLAPDVRGTLLYRASEHDYVAESVEARILRRIADELRQAGVPMLLPD